jgi:hypothetical protein
MKTLDLHRIWEILNFISEQEHILNNKDIYPDLLGNMSCYYIQGFDYFIEHYSFRIDKDEICIFNDDQIPYEDYTTNDFSYIPKQILSFNDEQLMGWVNDEVAKHLIKEEENKEKEKENIKNQIENLTKRLSKL